MAGIALAPGQVIPTSSTRTLATPFHRLSPSTPAARFFHEFETRRSSRIGISLQLIQSEDRRRRCEGEINSTVCYASRKFYMRSLFIEVTTRDRYRVILHMSSRR